MGKILIVEDDINIREGFVKIVGNINENLEVFETGAAGEALIIAQTEEIDVFFLDIQLEDYSGLELAKQIREINIYKLTPIIFITGAHCNELEAYRSIHCYAYILKPFSMNEVTRVFKDITDGIPAQKLDKIIKIKEKGFTYIVNQDDLIYVEAINKKLFIKTTKEKTDIKYSSLSKLSEQLSGQFIRCHKSFIVNTCFITKIDRINNVIYVQKKETPIPIGRKYKENFIGSS